MEETPLSLRSKIRYEKEFIDSDLAGPEGYFTNRLINELPWENIIWARTGRPLPRKILRCSSDEPYPEIVLEILEVVKMKFNTNLNILGCFLNFYEHKDHWLPYHKDQYGCNIISLSFGSTREFTFQNIRNKSTLKFNLVGGDMIYFPEEVNNNWKHGIMKERNNVGPRVNITIFTTNQL